MGASAKRTNEAQYCLLCCESRIRPKNRSGIIGNYCVIMRNRHRRALSALNSCNNTIYTLFSNKILVFRKSKYFIDCN